jgi:hypothetical protein
LLDLGPMSGSYLLLTLKIKCRDFSAMWFAGRMFECDFGYIDADKDGFCEPYVDVHPGHVVESTPARDEMIGTCPPKYSLDRFASPSISQ